MDFFEIYNSYSNLELLWVIENPNDYQPEAIETAKLIIVSRNLSEEEFQSLQKELENLRNEKILKDTNKNKLNQFFPNCVNNIFSNLSPSPNDQLVGNRLIITIAIAFTFIFIYYFFHNWKIIFYSFSVTGDFSIYIRLFYVFPLIYLSIAIVSFLKHKKLGWVLIIIIEFFALFTYLIILFVLLRNDFFNTKQTEINANIPSPSWITTTFLVLFWILALLTTCSKKIRDVFKISFNFLLTLIGILIIIFFLSIFILRSMK
jgi:hypothetical protein